MVSQHLHCGLRGFWTWDAAGPRCPGILVRSQPRPVARQAQHLGSCLPFCSHNRTPFFLVFSKTTWQGVSWFLTCASRQDCFVLPFWLPRHKIIYRNQNRMALLSAGKGCGQQCSEGLAQVWCTQEVDPMGVFHVPTGWPSPTLKKSHPSFIGEGQAWQVPKILILCTCAFMLVCVCICIHVF